MAVDLKLRFNWRFLVDLIVALLLVLFFLFYFNRVFGKALFYAIRKYTWYRYQAYIDVQALQISLLGGRIFFQGLRYHGKNQTIRVNTGHITWRYWLRKVRNVDVQRFDDEATAGNSEEGETGGVENATDLPCRIAVQLQGFEWFVYNRSPAYDFIVQKLGSQVNLQRAERPTDTNAESGQGAVSGGKTTTEKLLAHLPTVAIKNVIENLIRRGVLSKEKAESRSSLRDSVKSDAGSDASAQRSSEQKGASVPLLLQVLPIHVECNRGGIVLGNENTKGLLVVQFSKAKGDIDAGASGPNDQYRQLITFAFVKPKVHMRTNLEYREDQSSAAARLKQDRAVRQSSTHKSLGFWRRQATWTGEWLRSILPVAQRPKDSPDKSNGHSRNGQPENHEPASEWIGLSRYLEDTDQFQQERWSQLDYAEYCTLVDSPAARLSFYWDESGLVRQPQVPTTIDINGTPPPEWGIDIALTGGTISYGPWADHLRADLQSVFFPNLREDAVPAARLDSGVKRQSTEFKVFVEIDDTTTLRVPFREPSKDWKWKGKTPATDETEHNAKRRRKRVDSIAKAKKKGVIASEVRPFGWIDLKIAKNSTVSYTMDMIARQDGWANKLKLDLKDLEASSSVNHALLLRSESVSVECDLPAPLKWQSLHTWRFDVRSDGLELFLLRDHIYLLTDLVSDWTAGPLSDYFTFVPFQYFLHVDLSDFKLYLNVNDSNIINDPADLEDNIFLVIHGTGLKAEVGIPLNQYRPSQNEVSFNVAAHTGGLDLYTPSWNTQASFLDSNHVALLKELTVSGKYNYFTQTAPHLTDTLLLDIHGATLALDLHGFLIKYFLRIKENYFGEDMHFTTYEEHQTQLGELQDGRPKISPDELNFHRSNDLDVILFGSANSASVMLPTQLYTSREHIRIDIAEFALELRFTSYFMDLNFDCSPFSMAIGEGGDGVVTPESNLSNAQVFVNGLEIYGHRLFGLPPTEPTYLVNWDFAVGEVSGECSPEFLRKFLFSIRNFVFCFGDEENSMECPKTAPVHDVTYLRASISPIKLWLRLDDAAFLFQSGQIEIGLNDLAGDRFSDRLSLHAPSLTIACVNCEAASRHKFRQRLFVDTHALFTTGIELGLLSKKPSFLIERAKQHEHIRFEDLRTHRLSFLLKSFAQNTSTMGPRPPQLHSPAMPFPPVPLPLKNLARHTASEGSSTNSLPPSQKFQRAPQGPDSLLVNQTLSDTYSRPSSYRGSSTPGVRQISNMPAQVNSRFSSNFAAPYFPLQNVEPSAVNLPPADFDKHNEGDDKNEASEEHPDRLYCNARSDVSYKGLVIEAPGGIRGFLMPSAISAVTALVSQLEPAGLGEALDKLQIETISSIAGADTPKSVQPASFDLAFVTPVINLRFLNPLSGTVSGDTEIERDEFALKLKNINLSLRRRAFDTESNISSFILHAYCQSLNASIQPRCYLDSNNAAAVEIQVSRILLWAEQLRHNIMSGGQCMEADVSFFSKRAIDLTKTFERLASMVKSIASSFERIAEEQRHRVRLLLKSLSESNSTMREPAFLTRPSQVLRSAANHLRTKHQWRTVMTLRNLLRNLTLEDRYTAELAFKGKPSDIAIRPDSELSDFLRKFGQEDENDERSSQPRANTAQLRLETSLSLGKLGFSIDPGPNQNEIVLDNLTVKAAIEDMTEIHSTDSQKTSNKRKLAIEIKCAKAALRCNWDLCKLVEDMTTEIISYTSTHRVDSKPKSLATKSLHERDIFYEVQVMAAIESGVIALDGINIAAVFVSKDLISSIIYSTRPSSQFTDFAILVASQALTYEIVSRSQVLAFSKLKQPSLSFTFSHSDRDISKTLIIKVAASAEQAVYEVRQEVVAVLEVFDLVLKDEVHRLLALTKRFANLTGPESKETASPSKKRQIIQVHAALFLESYELSFEVLPSLSYIISGHTTQLSCSPVRNDGHILDFDMKHHSHNVQSRSSGNARSVSLLKMPPINGRVITRFTSKENFVQVLMSIESIKLDAAAVNSLINAMHRPQVSKAIEDIRTECENLSSHIGEIFGTSKSDSPKAQKKTEVTIPFVYDVRVTAAGLSIHASAPALFAGTNLAQVDFMFGLVRVKATNRLKKKHGLLKFPDIRVGLQHISFELSRTDSREKQSCGHLSFEANILCTSKETEIGDLVRSYHIKSGILEVELLAETASTIVDVVGNLQDRLKDFDLSKEVKYFQKIGQNKLKSSAKEATTQEGDQSPTDSLLPNLVDSIYTLELAGIQVSWLINDAIPMSPGREIEDLVFSLAKVELSTNRQNAARLLISNLQLQMTPRSAPKQVRSSNSALLPEVVFNVAYLSTKEERRLAFQAEGKSLDLRLTSDSILPANDIETSIVSAVEKFRNASASWNATPTKNGAERKKVFGRKRLGSLLVDADFAGAVVYFEGRRPRATGEGSFADIKGSRPQSGRYGQFIPEKANTQTVMRAPGIAFKVEYKDTGKSDPSLNAEVKVDASTNILYPTIVPLILEMSSSVKEIVSDTNKDLSPKTTRQPSQIILDGENILKVDPTTIWGKVKLNVGLRICKQEFSLSCQPLARVAAMAKFDDIYITVNTVKSTDLGKFFALSTVISKFQMSVQHDYSRDSTASFEVESAVLSLMNSRHVSGISGLSAILQISPMRARINAKQLQDFLLFREIWLPEEMRHRTAAPVPQPSESEPQTFLVQRYQQVAATGAFPWNATVAIAEIELQMDLGQALGRPTFKIADFWVTSRKMSDLQQNLCISFGKIGIESTGRLSGLVELQHLKVRTSIKWLFQQREVAETPLIQASLGFETFRAKISFDYQCFLIADIASFEFMMYNVRDKSRLRSDRLVGILDGDRVQVFATTGSSAQGLALFQAIDRLIQEKKAAFESSLKDLEKFLHRKSVVPSYLLQHHASEKSPESDDLVGQTPISLHTDVVVTLKSLSFGAYPSTFYDRQIFKIEAHNAEARFAVRMERGKLHSGLGLTLGELRVALSSVKRPNVPKALAEVDIDEVIKESAASHGGIILRVPRVVASMQTWQEAASTRIDYVFRSSFEGKVDVGWNYSRISFIRGMWENHSKALAQRLGKPLPQSAVQITGGPKPNSTASELDLEKVQEDKQEKITAVVNVPQSRYEYVPLEPAIIETPQLRDMGEATPPLEWIGLHRDRLPNVTHQIVIVTLLEVASEVEDAYFKILGTS